MPDLWSPRILEAIRDRLPTSLGAKTAANSLPVTLSPDGSLVSAVGTTSDSAATSDTGNFNLLQLLKRLLSVNLLRGQQTAANSFSTVLASDQAPIQVTATTASGQLLNARTTTGNGNTVTLPRAYKDFQIQLSINSGTLTNLSIDIQASATGAKWATVANFADITDGGILFLLNTPTQYFKANVNTLAGTSPNISLNLVGC